METDMKMFPTTTTPENRTTETPSQNGPRILKQKKKKTKKVHSKPENQTQDYS